MSSVLYDVPGPRARRRAVVGSVVGGLLLLALVAWAVVRLASNGVFDAERWAMFVEEPEIWTFLGTGLLATLRAAAIAAVLAAVVGLALAVLRLSTNRVVRGVTAVVVELFRGLPVVLLMFFAVVALGLPILHGVVCGLTIYNAAIVSEILRAGIVSLPRGQREAGAAIGLSEPQILWTILLPQAVRRMLPALISQLVVLLKDTSLGYIISYAELLRSVDNLQNFYGSRSLIPLFFVGATIYIAVNLSLSRVAVMLERRGTAKAAGGTARADTVERLNAPAAGAGGGPPEAR